MEIPELLRIPSANLVLLDNPHVYITLKLPQISFKNTVNNPFPQVVGGGNNETSARVLILVKNGESLTLKSLDCSGNMQIFPIYTEDASLSSVTVDGGTLYPAFDSNRTEYQIMVSKSISMLSISGQASSETATVKGNITNKACTIGEKIVITVTAEDGTSKKYTFEVVLSTSSSIIPNNGIIKIYPNVLGQGSPLSIELDKPYGNVAVRIYNTEGKEVHASQLNDQQATIPLSLKQGVYIINFGIGEKKITDKFVVR